MEGKVLFVAIFLCLFHDGRTQSDSTTVKTVQIKRSVGLLTGLALGKYKFAEAGISKNSTTVVGYHPFSSSLFASTELKLGGKFLLGPKIGFWVASGSSGTAMGINTIYYTDFDNGSLVFRPEIGIGLSTFKLVYGYNAILTKHRLEGINRNMASLVYCFHLRTRSGKTSIGR